MEWYPGNDAGAQLAPVRKFLIHTTEGSSIEGAIAAYEANNSWPHETVDYRFGYVPRRVGHLHADRAARSLRNESGGVETNRDGVYQIEVVGFATKPNDINWERLARDVIGPVCAAQGIPVASTVTFVAYPASYGLGAIQRLTGSAWDFYEGILGHQHAPENTHGDPGAIPIKAILEAITSAPPLPTPYPEDVMPLPVISVPDDREGRDVYKALYPGGYVELKDIPDGGPTGWERYQYGVNAGLYQEMVEVDARTHDVSLAECLRLTQPPVTVDVDEEAIADAVVDALPPINQPTALQVVLEGTATPTAADG